MVLHPGTNNSQRISTSRRLRRGAAWALVWLAAGVHALAQAPGPAAAPEDDIRPARPVVEIPKPEAFPWTAVWVSAAALLVLAALVWWWLSRRGLLPSQSPGRRALAALDAVDRERTRLEPGPLADRAAGVVRQFIAERFGIAAPQRTTEEFLHALANGAPQPLAAHQELLQRFLQSCDMAKFAGAEFDNAERLQLLSGAINFVRAAAETEGGRA